MKRQFTKYPSNYIKASNDFSKITRDDIIRFIEDPLEEKIREYYNTSDVKIYCTIGEIIDVEVDIDDFDTILTADYGRVERPEDLEKYVSTLFKQLRQRY